MATFSDKFIQSAIASYRPLALNVVGVGPGVVLLECDKVEMSITQSRSFLLLNGCRISLIEAIHDNAVISVDGQHTRVSPGDTVTINPPQLKQPAKEEEVRKLYEVVLVHLESNEVKQQWVIAPKGEDAIQVAIVREKLTEEDLPKWFKVAHCKAELPV